MTYPVFSSGDVLNASDMNAVGLWLVKSQAVGSGVSSVTVTGAFSSTYDNYFIAIDNVVCSASDTTLWFRPGNDTSTSTYFSGGWFVLWNGTGNGWHPNNGTTSGIGVGITSTTNMSLGVQVFDPFLAKWTRAVGTPSGGDNYIANYGGVQKSTAQYSAFTLYPASGTMTGGTIRVYGYRN